MCDAGVELLNNLFEAKGNLIKKAQDIDALPVEIDKDSHVQEEIKAILNEGGLGK